MEKITNNGEKGKISRFIQSCLTQLLAMLPLVYIYSNLRTIRPLVVPDTSEPLLTAAALHQIALAPVFSILAAIACSIYFLLKWNGFKSKKNIEIAATAAETEPGWQRLLTALVFGLLMQALVLTRCWQFPVALDDPFIDFRYVQNWASFKCFDYNASNHIQGYSSVLHLAMLFISTIVSPLLKADIASLSIWLNTILQIGNLLLIFAIAGRAFKSQILALLAAFVYCFCASSGLAATDGKESALLQMLLLCSLLTSFSFTGHRVWCPRLSVLISLTRPEGILFYLRELLSDVIERGKACLGQWIPASAVLILWYSFVFYYYGSVIPHGAIGRANMFHTAAQLSVHSCPFILMMIGVDTFKHLYISLSLPWPSWSLINFLDLQLLLKGTAALLLLLWYSRKEEWLRSYANNCALLLLFFAAFDPWFFSWYYSWFSLVAVFLTPLIVRTGWNFIRANSPLKKIAGLSILAIILIPQIIDLNLINWLGQSSATRAPLMRYLAERLKAPLFVLNPAMERLALYKHAADYLNQAKKTNSFSTLATWEPGVLGYYLPDTEIIDLGGLVSDEPLKYYPVPVSDRTRRPVWGSIPTRAVLDLKPDRVIFYDSFADNGLLKNKIFLQSYKLVHFWPLHLWDGQGLFLFEKI